MSRTVRSLLGDLHDSQSQGEAGYYADQIVVRVEEDLASISEFVHCDHISHASVMMEKMKEAGWSGGRLSDLPHAKGQPWPELTRVVLQ